MGWAGKTPPTDSEETWLVQQKREDKSPDNMLQELLKRRTVNQPQPTKDISQPKRQNLENILEIRVIPRAEDITNHGRSGGCDTSSKKGGQPWRN